MGEKIKYDAVTPRPKFGKPNEVWWHRVGSAIQNEKGQISIYLDSVPVPDPTKENKICIMLFEQREREERSSSSTTSRRPAMSTPGKRDDMDDEIPF